MNIISIPLDKIFVGPRLRGVDEAYAQMIAASFIEDGQRTPAEVRKADRKGVHALISGAHRERAARIAGFTELLAVVKDVPETEARLLEIDENLMRRELSALDRAIFLAERQAVYLLLHPETQHGGDRVGPNRQFGDMAAERFTIATAERVGLSERSIQRSIALAKKLSPEVRVIIAETPWADNASQLDSLARLEADEQVLVARLVIDGDAASLSDAIGKVRNLPPPSEPDQVKKFIKMWERCTVEEQSLIRSFIMRKGGAKPALERVA